MYDARLKFTSNITVAGPSQSGKTEFVIQLIKYKDIVFNEKAHHIVWCYSEVIPRKLPNITFHKGLIESEKILKQSIIIIDDLLQETLSSDELSKIFTRICHHRQCCIIFITQNLYQQGRFTRSITLNTHYLILFKNVRDKTIITNIARQMYPGNTKFLVEAYNHAISNQYGYLFIDLRPESIDLIRIRSDIFNKHYVYINE